MRTSDDVRKRAAAITHVIKWTQFRTFHRLLATHTASKTGGLGPNFDTGNISPGGISAQVTFNTAGTMTQRCNIHTNMTGTIQVNP